MIRDSPYHGVYSSDYSAIYLRFQSIPLDSLWSGLILMSFQTLSSTNYGRAEHEYKNVHSPLRIHFYVIVASFSHNLSCA